MLPEQRNRTREQPYRLLLENRWLDWLFTAQLVS
jgi:hypothetical protein